MGTVDLGYCANCGVHLYGITDRTGGYYNYTNMSYNDNMINETCPHCHVDRAKFCTSCVVEINDFSDPKYYSFCSGCGKKL